LKVSSQISQSGAKQSFQPGPRTEQTESDRAARNAENLRNFGITLVVDVSQNHDLGVLGF
jgi:hypothetical protein